MPTLEEYMQMLQVDPEQVARMQRQQALMGAGAGLLSGRNWQQGIGNAAIMGMQGYQSAGDAARQGAMDKMKSFGLAQQAASGDMDYAAKKRDFEDENKARDVLKGFSMPAPLPSMAPTPQNAQALSQAPKSGPYEQFMAKAQALEDAGLVKQAEKYRLAAEKYAPQYEGLETVMQNGKPVLLQKYKNRAPEVTGFQAKPEYKQRDAGGYLDFFDPLSGATTGRVDKTMDAAQMDASRRGWASNTLENKKFDYQKTKDEREQGSTKSLTESQAKATAYANQMSSATAVINGLAKEGFTGGGLQTMDVALARSSGEGILGGTAAAIGKQLSTPQAQKYHQAELQWTEAALRFMTGANAPEQEVRRNADTYFPRAGDKPEAIAQKAKMRQQMEQSIRLAAGAGAGMVPPLAGPATPSPRAASGAVRSMSDEALRKELGL